MIMSTNGMANESTEAWYRLLKNFTSWLLAVQHLSSPDILRWSAPVQPFHACKSANVNSIHPVSHLWTFNKSWYTFSLNINIFTTRLSLRRLETLAHKYPLALCLLSSLTQMEMKRLHQSRLCFGKGKDTGQDGETKSTRKEEGDGDRERNKRKEWNVGDRDKRNISRWKAEGHRRWSWEKEVSKINHYQMNITTVYSRISDSNMTIITLEQSLVTSKYAVIRHRRRN